MEANHMTKIFLQYPTTYCRCKSPHFGTPPPLLLCIALHTKGMLKMEVVSSQLQSGQGFLLYFLYLAFPCSIVFPLSHTHISFSCSVGGYLDNYTVSADSAVKPSKKLSVNQTHGDHRLPLNFTHSKSHR